MSGKPGTRGRPLRRDDTARGVNRGKAEAPAPGFDFDAAFALLRDASAPAAEQAAALSALCEQARKKEGRERIDAAFLERAPLERLLGADEPKLRKNAARLLGALGRGRDAAALAAALTAERTLFVVPSLLLALGSVGGQGAQSALAAYPVPTPADEAEEKHVREIAQALQRALGRFETAAFPPLKKLDAPRDVLLVPPAGFSKQLADELAELGFPAQAAGFPAGTGAPPQTSPRAPRPAPGGAPNRTPAAACSGGLLAHTEDIAGLYRARCAQEILLPVAENVPLAPAAVAQAFAPAPALPYRIELRGYAGDRAAFLMETARLLGGANNPSHYAVELRVVCGADTAALYTVPCNVPDHRYPCRRETIPASMHPAMAACLVRHAASLAPARAKDAPPPIVLDPCCGSGTLLFAREALSPCGSLLGVDLTERAVRAAKANAAFGHSRAKFIRKDCLAFAPREPVDELYANLPFGNRVGTHEDNEALYRGLVALLPRWLAKDGFALLYTMEFHLLARCLRHEPRLRLIRQTQTEAGGLTPHVFLVCRADAETPAR